MKSFEPLRRFFQRTQAPPEWGIQPVPREHRVLGRLDFAVLWGDLGIGLLVLLAGTFLVPALSLKGALLAIFIGSALGSLLLALVGVVGSDTGVPTMVLLRPILGVRGSYLPATLNALQLIGWTIFEFVVMGVAADTISRTLLGRSSYVAWAAIFAAIVILMGVGGPVGVVRQWLEKFAVWVALATGVWLTYHVIATHALAALIHKAGNGSLPFWDAVDLVIALPVSWLPLVADYNRFARKSGGAFWSTAAGFFVTNAWFLSLGVFILLGSQVSQEPKNFAAAIALFAGWVALLILLADETHNAWADLYSAAVSLQNVFPRVKQRWLIVGLGVACLAVAVVLDVTQYQGFLYLIGSFFIPLFGILVADYFILRRRHYDVEELYLPHGAYWYRRGLSARGLITWAVGLAVYHITNPTTLSSLFPAWQKLIPVQLTVLGGSLPSFIVPFLLYLLVGLLFPLRTDRLEPKTEHT